MDEYGTFNPNAESKMDFGVARQTLHSKLHNLYIEEDNK
jgi:hypothetical protein